VFVCEEDGRLVGVLTERDIFGRIVAGGVDLSQPVESLMTRDPRTLDLVQTIRDAIEDVLPPIAELERRLNRALTTELPKALRRKTRMIAIDLTLIPYHGQPARDKKEIYRGEPKSGTTHFHAYATAAVVHKGHRYTLALTRVEYGETMKECKGRTESVARGGRKAERPMPTLPSTRGLV